MRSNYIKILLSFLLFVFGITGILSINNTTIDNILISVVAGCFIEFIVGLFEYNFSKRNELEKFLREIIHSYSDFKPELFSIDSKDTKKIDKKIMEIIDFKPRCNIELLSDIYANSKFFINNKDKNLLLYDIYHMHSKYKDSLCLLQFNLKRWVESGNNHYSIPIHYINEFKQNSILIKTNYLKDLKEIKNFNIYGYIVDKQIQELQKMIYGRKLIKEKQDKDYTYNHLISFNEQELQQYLFSCHYDKNLKKGE